jgi:hypothetical protein
MSLDPNRYSWRLAAGLALAFAAGLTLASCASLQRMHSALYDLRVARADLEASDQDQGGHRVAALHLVDQAILEVHAGIQSGPR